MTGRESKKNNVYPPLPDDSSEDEEVPVRFRTTEEERDGTIPGSREATIAALAQQRAQGNPVVRRATQTSPKPRLALKPKDNTSNDDKNKRSRRDNDDDQSTCSVA